MNVSEKSERFAISRWKYYQYEKNLKAACIFYSFIDDGIYKGMFH